MINVTVKTLDSQNHAFDVEDDATVKQFKEVISPTIGIPVEQQRLIFRGRVLQDDKKISEYNVANNVIHVVQRPANQNSTANDEPPPRSNSQAGGRVGDGLFIAADDVGGGGGRNAIIMGAIGLPTIDIEGGTNEDGSPAPRRSGAQVRLMVGNLMLNRASTLLQQLEDDDATVAAAAAAAASTGDGDSPGTRQEQNSSGNDSGSQDDIGMLDEDIAMDIDDDPSSIERVISQIVNASSAAALVAAVRQVQPGTAGSSGNQPSQPTSNNSSLPRQGNVGSASDPSTGSTTGSNSSANSSSANQTGRSTRRPESPRLRELATALQDFLALQDRLNPFLHFIQDALRQNRLYTEPGETQSTQFAYDTVSTILHLLSHSLHSFSDIMCDFSMAPETRRLNAPTSILVEQSTVVRATIPVAAMPAAAMGGAMNASNNNSSGTNPPSTQPTFGSGENPNPLAGLGITLPLGQMGRPIPISIPVSMSGMSSQPWRNPNLQGNATPAAGNAQTSGTSGTADQNSQPQQQATVNPTAPTRPPASSGGTQQIGGLPAGLQNLGALLGMAGAGAGTVNVNVFGAGGPVGAGAFIPPNAIPIGSFQMGISNNNNNNSSGSTASGGAATTPTSAGQQNSTSTSGSSTANSGNASANPNSNTNGVGMFQNLLRNEMNRPHFDTLLPCHTYHTSGRFSRSNQTRPAEFRQFVNVGGAGDPQAFVVGQIEGESLEIIMDILRNSRMLDLLQPVVKDVVLNYLMRGRDPNNESHIKTCAKSLARKILPFFEKISGKIPGQNESVDMSATYLNVVTDFIAGMMKKVIGGGQLKVELFASTIELEKKLIQIFKVCYPNSANSGLPFIDYLVDQLLGGMSIVFKNQTREKLIGHLKSVEQTIGGDALTSFIVYKQQEAVVATSGVVPSSSSSTASIVSSRCAASFGNASSSSGVEVESSSNTDSPIKQEPTLSNATPIKQEPILSDDVDIDEVLQVPASMVRQPSIPQRRSTGSNAAQGVSNQTESVTTLIRNLPTEWESTIMQDINRQREMPPQPSFSPGYNTLFPRKH